MVKIYYNDNGTIRERAELHNFKYNGEYCGERSLQGTISSPVTIPFQLGDYCDFRGERFYLDAIPQYEKCARPNTYGSAFTYKDMKFNSLIMFLQHCLFYDWVLNDNTEHNSFLGDFSFYVTNYLDIIDRVKANLIRFYGNEYTFNFYFNDQEINIGFNREFTKIYDKDEYKSIAISAGTNCYDALKLLQEHWELTILVREEITNGVPSKNIYVYANLPMYAWKNGSDIFYTLSDTPESYAVVLSGNGMEIRQGITIYGYEDGRGVTVDTGGQTWYARSIIDDKTYGEPHTSSTSYRYGKDNGFMTIERNVNQNTPIITRLRAYGSNRNIPYRFFNNFYRNPSKYPALFVGEATSYYAWRDDINESPTFYIKEQIPTESSAVFGEIDSDLGTFGKLENATITRVYINDLRQVYRIDIDYTVGEQTFSYITNHVDADLKGTYILEAKYITKLVLPYKGENLRAWRLDTLEERYVYTKQTEPEVGDFVFDEKGNQLINWHVSSIQSNRIELYCNGTNRFAYRRAGQDILGSTWNIEGKKVDMYVRDDDAIAQYGLLEGEVTFDGSDEDWNEIYPRLEDAKVIRVNESTEQTNPWDCGISADGTYEENSDDIFGNPIYSYFYIDVSKTDIGFDINDYIIDEDKAKIVMTSGECNGMEFDILEVTDLEELTEGSVRNWRLKLNRYQNQEVNMVYPNCYADIASGLSQESDTANAFKIMDGDTFVLTGIRFPEEYVYKAQIRLYEQALKYLKEYNHPHYFYTPKVDNIFLNKHKQIADGLVEGKQICIGEDVDVDIPQGGMYITIKNLEISVDDTDIDTYSITLDGELEDKIQIIRKK